MQQDNDAAGLIAALVLTFDQHFDGFLDDFEQNAARIHDSGEEDDQVLKRAGLLARQILLEDIEHGRRRGTR